MYIGHFYPKVKKMKTVLITGANKGIGFETAKQLTQQGYFVYLGSRNKQRGHDAVDKLKNLGISNVACIEIDVTKPDTIKQAKQELENTIDALDILINNAGIAGPQIQNISEISISDLRIVMETNFFGAVQTIQEFIPLLKKSELPVIVNVSSGLGSLNRQSDSNNPNYQLYNCYSLSKTALNAITVLLANEFSGTTFKINSVSPGYTATDLNQFKGTGTIEQGAKTIVEYATLDKDGPTGKFFYNNMEMPW